MFHSSKTRAHVTPTALFIQLLNDGTDVYRTGRGLAQRIVDWYLRKIEKQPNEVHAI